MVVRLRLSDGRRLYTELALGNDKREPLEVLKDILENNASGWLGASPNAALSGAPRLVSVGHIVSAQVV